MAVQILSDAEYALLPPRVKRINFGDGNHYLVLNADGTTHSAFKTRKEAERQASALVVNVRPL